jgi:hypothetical protein
MRTVRLDEDDKDDGDASVIIVTIACMSERQNMRAPSLNTDSAFMKLL